jgi:polysaccharide biosynthesis protein VpsQ
MKRLTVLFSLFIILIIVLADSGNLGILRIVNRIPFGDKIGHFVLYGILTLLLDLTSIRSLPKRSPRLIIVTMGLLLILLIGLEEYSQKYFSKRTFDLVDLTFSYLGVTFFSWVAIKSGRRDILSSYN